MNKRLPLGTDLLSIDLNLKKLIQNNKLYVEDGFMSVFLDKTTLSSLIHLNLVFDKEKTIGWAAIWEITQDNESASPMLSVGVFIKKEYRGKGLAKLALEEVLNEFLDRTDLVPEQTTITHCAPSSLFYPAITKIGLKSEEIDAIPVIALELDCFEFIKEED